MQPPVDTSVADLTVLAELAAELQQLEEEDRAYELLAHGLRRVTDDDAVIHVSSFELSRGVVSSKALLGCGPVLDPLTDLLGRPPNELSGAYTEAAKRAMASGRLTRVEGGLEELARDVLPPALCRDAAALLGVEDVYVVGFSRGSAAGGVAIITRR